MEIKKEVVSEVLSNKDIFLNYGIILEDFDFEIGNYEQLLRKPFLVPEISTAHLRIPLKSISKNVFEFSVFLSRAFEPNIGYQLYRNIFPIKRPEVSLEVSFSDSFVEENFKGNWNAFMDYAEPILKEYFDDGEIGMFLGTIGSVVIEIEPYIKYKEIIIWNNKEGQWIKSRRWRKK